MAQSHCLKHQDRPATARCTSCLKPLCDECTHLGPDQKKYCSEACFDNAVASKAKLDELKRHEAELARERARANMIKAALFLMLCLGIYIGWDLLPPAITEPVEKLIRELRK